jgi:hypothetical protein
VNGVPAAYQVQQEAVAVWRQQGRRVAGAKIGLTAKAVQEQLGVGEPDFGMLFADMILKNGATVARGAVMQPRVEAEIAFVMKRDLAGSHITPEAVIAATDYVVPAIEICGSRIADCGEGEFAARPIVPLGVNDGFPAVAREGQLHPRNLTVWRLHQSFAQCQYRTHPSRQLVPIRISGVTAIVLPALAPERLGSRPYRARSPDTEAALCPHRARAAGSVRSR